MTSTRVSRRRLLGWMVTAGLVPASAVAGGCSGDEPDDRSGVDRDRDRGEGHGPSRDATASPEPEDFAGRSPLTGRRVDEHGPVLAVKIDNLAAARPHRGVRAADLVYVEPVEAGLSRLLAVFSSEFPDRIGPVRSARESDIDILRPFGRPGFAYSGANEVVLSLLADAEPVRLSPDRLGEAYSRSAERSAPHNLYLDPGRLLDSTMASEVSTVRDIGFRFGPAPDGGERVRTLTVSYPAFELAIRPDPAAERWRLAMDGAPYDASPATVVIQRVRQRPSKHRRLRDYGSPFLVTTGQGRATVLRNGRAYPARWSRPTAADPTTFHAEDGSVIDFTRGQTWIVYDTS